MTERQNRRTTPVGRPVVARRFSSAPVGRPDLWPPQAAGRERLDVRTGAEAPLLVPPLQGAAREAGGGCPDDRFFRCPHWRGSAKPPLLYGRPTSEALCDIPTVLSSGQPPGWLTPATPLRRGGQEESPLRTAPLRHPVLTAARGLAALRGEGTRWRFLHDLLIFILSRKKTLDKSILSSFSP